MRYIGCLNVKTQLWMDNSKLWAQLLDVSNFPETFYFGAPGGVYFGLLQHQSYGQGNRIK